MFNVGDKIVYPMHGAGTIDSIEEKDILGEKQSYYILKMPSNVKVMIPTAKADAHCFPVEPFSSSIRFLPKSTTRPIPVPANKTPNKIWIANNINSSLQIFILNC